MERGKGNHGGMPEDRSTLAGEHALTDTGQLILFAVFLGTWISDSFVFRFSLWAAAVVPLYLRIPLCAAALFGSIRLALPAHRAIFGSALREPGVIRHGVFSRVRHPMYLGAWLFPLGLTVLTGSAASAGVCVLLLLFYLLVSRHEERLLVEKHGSAYREYVERVPMFFPLRLRGGSARRRPRRQSRGRTPG